MKLQIPGQLRGPETKCVMSVATRLRKEYEERFAEFDSAKVQIVAPVLRVGGSLGSFGSDGIENIEFKNGVAECDLVVSPRNWEDMHSEQIYALLKPKLLEAFRLLFDSSSEAASILSH